MKLIPLTQGLFSLVDDADFSRASKRKWIAQRVKHGWYAARRDSKGYHYLHREVLGVSAGLRVDHRNGFGLDNRRSNLRRATHKENCRAFKTAYAGKTSAYRGVCKHSLANRWMAQITVNGRRNYLGLYPTEEEAARAYDNAARRYFGVFAQFNLARF